MIKKKVKTRIKMIDIQIQNHSALIIYRPFSLFGMSKDLEMLKFEKKILKNLLK
jgi:hypothetical protein